MRKFFITQAKQSTLLVVLCFLVVSPFAPLLAQAQTLQETISTPTQQQGTSGGFDQSLLNSTVQSFQAQGQSTGFQNPDTSAGASAAQASGGASSNGTSNPSNPSGSINSDLSCTTTFSLAINCAVYVFTVGIGSGFAYVAAYFFDFAIQLSLSSAAYALDFVSQGWTTARDLANMAFLFILIYIAFVVMFKAETSETLPMLALVIVIALLVNFSFFFTRLVIDGGNILAVQFYNAIDAPSIGSGVGTQGFGATAVTTATQFLTPGAANTKDLTASIMGMLQLQNLFNNQSFQQFTNTNGFLANLIATIFLYISAAIMLWLLTVAFVTNGIKFLIRVVVLWFLIIASPLAFVARAVPKFEGYYKQWQEALITHAFYPVAFMFIFLILTNFASQLALQGGLINSIFGGIQAGQANGAGFIASIGITIANIAIRMGFVIAILWVGMEASKKIGVMGAKSAEHIGEWVGGGYKKLGGFAYQQSIARAGSALNYGAGQTRLGNTWVGQKLRNYTVKPVADSKILGAKSYTEYREKEDKLKKERQAGYRDAQNRIATQELLTGKSYDFGRTLTKAEIKEREDKVKNFGKREIEAMSSSDLEKLAGVLKESTIKTIKDSDKFSDSEKEKISAAWNEQSSDAPLKKANKQIELLRQINETLKAGANPMTVAAIDTRIGTTTARADSIIDSAAVTAMLKDVNLQLANVRSQIKANPGGTPAAVALQQNLHNLQDAVKKLDKLDEERKNIPTKTGGHADSGTFDTSKVV